MRGKALWLGLFLSVIAGNVWSANRTQVQDVGAISTGTIFTVSATTTPVLLLSTGTNVMGESGSEGSFFVERGTSSLPVRGQYMDGRVFLEVYNDTTKDIWLGYTIGVSTQEGANYGRRIPSGASWSSNSSIRDYWVVSDTTTARKIVVTQEK